MRDPKHPRQFTEEFRRQIVALVDSGKPRAEVMREYDLGKSTLDRWIRRVHACGSTAAADNRMLAHPPRPKAPDPIEPDVLGAFEASRGGYGARRLKVALERAGATASRRGIRRIMGEDGLSSAYSGHAPKGGDRPVQLPSAENVLATPTTTRSSSRRTGCSSASWCEAGPSPRRSGSGRSSSTG